MNQQKLIKSNYHLTTKNNWMNDPNGFIEIDGVYHLYFQYNPNNRTWGDIHWGHATSTDLIHWKSEPIALFPQLENQEKHCFSGSAAQTHEGQVVFFYTSIGDGIGIHQSSSPQQWMALATKDSMNVLQQEMYNPVMTQEIHGDLKVGEWRDPFLFNREDTWYALIGGIIEGRGSALLYSSDNLIDWTFLSVIAQDEEITNHTWECPNLFPLEGGKWLLFYSPEDMVQFRIGTITHDKFHTEQKGILDYSGWAGFYAPQGTIDSRGRLLLFGWMPETGRPDYKHFKTNLCQMSLPRELMIGKNGSLQIHPSEEVRLLLENKKVVRNFLVNENTQPLLHAKSFYVKLQNRILPESSISIQFLNSKDNSVVTTLIINPTTKIITLDRSLSTLNTSVIRKPQSAPIGYTTGEPFILELFVDHTSIEVFSCSTTALSSRVYPITNDQNSLIIKSKSALCIDVLEYQEIEVEVEPYEDTNYRSEP